MPTMEVAFLNPRDAQSSLDDIRRLQETTRNEIVRRSFAMPRVIIVAFGLFISFAAIDLGAPWQYIGGALGFALFVAVGVVYEYRSAVRRQPTVQEALYHSVVLIGVCMVFAVGRILAFALLGAPAHGLMSQAMAGAVLGALAYVAAVPLNRLVMRSLVQQGRGRR
ncbi:hypothetical protein Nocox_37795 [Nonomuraea coxensis DSM 45129]|uniref:Uncharacterized protein n=1 Tax=Nonomuraea coxensis DSM 45129 TaxID=1122611 RepID=A0ABX8UBF1_9ACTN|nr:hypothetical protein [Nonomuraea coxensis]QYC45111.1 hypothetical protein Nocox_37795 [Nonomuraea coxensis DSM 45129]